MNDEAPPISEVSDDPGASPAAGARRSLKEIGLQTGTDKIFHHHYDRIYPLFLETWRDQPDMAMFEIGLDEGKSLAMWLAYFPLAYIYGLDIGKSYEGPRHRTFLADQSDVETLRSIARSQIKHPVFLVVDDGSHLPEHQLLSFSVLFEQLLQPGGVYIIEDIEVSYWTKGGIYSYGTRYGYKHPMSVLEVFKDIVDCINDEFLTEANRYAVGLNLNRFIPPATRNQIATVTFGKNCIVITKKSKDELAESRRSYRHADKL